MYICVNIPADACELRVNAHAQCASRMINKCAEPYGASHTELFGSHGSSQHFSTFASKSRRFSSGRNHIVLFENECLHETEANYRSTQKNSFSYHTRLHQMQRLSRLKEHLRKAHVKTMWCAADNAFCCWMGPVKE